MNQGFAAPTGRVQREKRQRQTLHGKLKRYYPFAGYYNEPDETLRQEIEGEFGKKKTLVLLKCEECVVVFRLPVELKVKFG